MDLMFYTICPRHNKSLILNIITRIVEGRDARYITGSGQTIPTNDRVLIYSTIGECEVNSNSNNNRFIIIENSATSTPN